MNLSGKRILADAEKRMTKTTDQHWSVETTARYARMGITPDMQEPERIRRLYAIQCGNYPDTMTTDDIEHIRAIVARLEAEC